MKKKGMESTQIYHYLNPGNSMERQNPEFKKYADLIRVYENIFKISEMEDDV